MKKVAVLVILAGSFLLFPGCQAQRDTDNPLQSFPPQKGEDPASVPSSEDPPITGNNNSNSANQGSKYKNLSLEEELKLTKLCEDAYHFNSFPRAVGISDEDLLADTAFYLLFRYDGDDRDQMVHRSGDRLYIDEEAIDRFSWEFFGKKLPQHQSAAGYEYQNGNYYVPPMDNHGMKVAHIQEYIDHGDGTYTVKYDLYYIHETDIAESVFFGLRPEEVLELLERKPKREQLPEPNVHGQLMLKKMSEDGRERYIILENLKTDIVF